MARQVEDLQEVDLLEIESLGRLKHVNLLGPWAGGSPSRVRHDNLLGTLGRSRQVDLLGPLNWELGIPKISSVTSAG